MKFANVHILAVTFGALCFLLIGSDCCIAETDMADACARIDNNDQRLLCYDLLFRKSVSTSTVSQWEVKQEKSKIDDSENVYMSVDSLEIHSRSFGQPDHLRLMIFCRERRTDVFIQFAGEYMSDIQGGGRTTFRLDKNKAFEMNLIASTSHKALGLPTSENLKFVKSLFGGKNLFVRAAPYNQSAVSADFPVQGLEEAIKPLRSACGW